MLTHVEPIYKTTLNLNLNTKNTDKKTKKKKKNIKIKEVGKGENFDIRV